MRPRCLNPLRPLLQFSRTRGVATTFIKKQNEGKERWEKRAEKIQTGELPHVWDILQERGYIKDVAGYVTLRSTVAIQPGLTCAQQPRDD